MHVCGRIGTAVKIHVFLPGALCDGFPVVAADAAVLVPDVVEVWTSTQPPGFSNETTESRM